MGNAGSTSMHRERHKSSDLSTPNSPFREMPGRGDSVASASGVVAVGSAVGGGAQAFTFDKNITNDKNVRSVLLGGSSQEDEDQPYYTKPVGSAATTDTITTPTPRKRANTVSEGSSTPQHNNSGSNMSVKEAAGNSNDDKEECSTEDLPRNSGLPTVLRWDGGGKNVMISGTFSKWKPLPMARSHGNFVAIIDLPEGDHQYKFYVDGEWKHDPKLKSIENEDGIKNNLVSVRQSDFEVFQALAKDSENAPNYAEREYSQEVPQPKPWEKVSGPPVLPPHLLQVILNKDTPLSCEPTLLPEPNHVMLNHLYALSIKDGVMVLSATHRYRKKYVTTLLYKPI
ncbi:5'-AMP-activated protein kinase subunit beta-1 [Rhagoletis pomonella]|uniref:5'-AMP-activated protein kinase subunit beta-1 n=1 Tax=Rhagoletis pomonella TaxID=28610 RepID=UPI00177F59E2|nr:5'-AMP-activated protein kinase subunit beta-1 [Rhagoletis pomonella]XP_036331132.1 5'-AMP-activated protein kinase subunit beta-1 [Rhagoletis pomonella]